MKCILNATEQEELLLGYTAGTLDGEAARTFQRHLTTCAECNQMVALQQMVDVTLNEWKMPEVSASFDAKLMAQIRAIESKPGFLERWFGSWKWAVAAVPACALALTVYFWPAPAPPALEAHEVVEVERTLDDLEAFQALHQAGTEKTPDTQQELL